MHLKSRILLRALVAILACLTAVVGTVGPASAASAPGSSAVPQLAAVAALAPTTTTLTTTRNPTYSSQSGGITARVRGKAALGIPTGWVDFYVDGEWWWSEVLDDTGRARLAYPNLELGTHSVTGVYSGDATYDTSASAGLIQTVLSTAPTAGLSYTPANVAPGAVSRLVLSATNSTSVNMPSLAMGLLLPAGATIVSSPPGVGCRRAWPNLFYCLTSARPGVTRKIVIDVTAPLTPGTITTSGYARNIDTMEESGATATLTVG